MPHGPVPPETTPGDEQQIGLLITQNADGILIVDGEGWVRFANPAAERLFQIPQAELIGKAFGYPVAGADKTEIEIVTKYDLDAGIVAEMRSVSTVWDGAPAYLVSLRDVTERKRSELEIQRLNRALEDEKLQLELANRELESFAYSVSHDLRAPLASIAELARTELQDGDATLTEESRHVLQLIRENALSGNRLVQALLGFSRTVRQPIARQEVDMQAVAARVWQEQSAAAGSRTVQLVIGDLPPAYADPDLIKQVWTNLLSNALKYTRRRDKAQIEIGSALQGTLPAYFVRDNGVGFEMAAGDKLFGVFQRLHSEDDYEGNGVGLALVDRIVRRHGGRVWAEAQVDVGATFYFTLAGEDGKAG